MAVVRLNRWAGRVSAPARPLAQLSCLLFLGLLVVLAGTARVRVIEVTHRNGTLAGVSQKPVRATEARRHDRAGPGAGGESGSRDRE